MQQHFSNVASIPETVTPTGSDWGSYWTGIVGLTMIMLLLYLAANGLLTQWLQLFVFTTPSSVQSTGTSTTSTASGGIASTLNSGLSSGLQSMGVSAPFANAVTGMFGF